MQSSGGPARRELLRRGFFAAASGITLESLFHSPLNAAENSDPEASIIGRRELVKGLDGMSWVSERGSGVFQSGHNAAAVMASAFFCREQRIDDETQKAMLSVIESRLLTSSIYEPRPKEAADPALVDGLVKDLDAGIDTLRQSGHNIIFTNMCLKALRAEPGAATPARVAGLRKMAQGFGVRRRGTEVPDSKLFIDFSDETKFVHFVFEEYLKAMDLYMKGRGHHGFAGHVITIGHALLELRRAGYKETADKGLPAYCEFVQGARDGAEVGGQKAGQAPPYPPTPRERAYWVEQKERPAGEIVSSHLVKYPYSFYALAKDVRDEDLKRRILAQLYYLTAIS